MDSKDRLRQRIAQEAARILAEEGIHDHRTAKQKAAARLGVAAVRDMPRNEEIDSALEEYHRLYRSERQSDHIRRLRTLALEAMLFLSRFAPKLVGGVLEGHAGEFSPITLHLHPETREDVILALLEAGIPFHEKTVTVPLGPFRSTLQQVLCFLVDDVEIRLILLTPDLKQPLLDRSSPKGGIGEVETLIRKSARAVPHSGLAIEPVD